MMEKLEPLGDRIVVRPMKREEITKSGIILPDTAKEKPQEGEVLAVGPGKTRDDGTRIPMELKPGDRVLYARYGGSEIKVNDEQLLIMSENDVLAVKEEGKAGAKAAARPARQTRKGAKNA